MNLTFAWEDDEDIVDLNKEVDKLTIDKDKEETLMQEQEPREPQGESQQDNDDLPKSWKYVKSHHLQQIIGNVEKGVRTRSLVHLANNFVLLSQIEPNNISKAKDD